MFLLLINTCGTITFIQVFIIEMIEEQFSNNRDGNSHKFRKSLQTSEKIPEKLALKIKKMD